MTDRSANKERARTTTSVLLWNVMNLVVNTHDRDTLALSIQ
ncbi:MAG: hypothetical protein U5O39_06125 [Gammaproteobacteria bacterium]|nr:hypothetical protein [Gammaproteobacteria bacterium]